MSHLLKIFMLSLLLSFPVMAEEGMWLYTQINNLGLQNKGLQIPLDQVYHPEKPSISDAVILLGGGTGEFVSSQGLALTNHHVAYSAVQKVSTKGIDYLTAGFTAKTMADEIPAPGMSARVLLEIRDVTKELHAVADQFSDAVERQEAIDKKINEMEESLNDGRDDISVSIATMYNGRQYQMYKYQLFEDVRLVYIPPQAIGNYGGEIDNWMWPRHTGDFSFVRIYMTPDGKGGAYDEANVPFRPKYWLPLSTSDLKDGDFTFIMGYPGSTRRYYTSHSVRYYQDYLYPRTVALYREIIDTLEKLAIDDPQYKIKVAGKTRRFYNAMKNYQGNIEGMNKSGFLARKQQYEAELLAHLETDPEMKEAYADVLPSIEVAYQESANVRERDAALLRLSRFSGDAFTAARTAYNVAREMAIPEAERDASFSESSIKRQKDRLKSTFINFFESADRALLRASLVEALNLPQDQRIAAIDDLFPNGISGIDTYLDDVFARTKMTGYDFVSAHIGDNLEELKKLDDPLIKLAASLYDDFEEREQRTDSFNSTVNELRKKYIDMLYSWQGSNMYPDANRTPRFTYGPVAGYAPRDAVWYQPFTSLKGVIEKDNGEVPFNMPAELRTLEQQQNFGRWSDPELNDVPVAFTHICDITGGNSGSPVLNARGEIIGIAFDGNYEAMTSDWQYNHAIQRTISVDIRYVMFITEKFGGATWLLDEMNQPAE